MDSVFLRAEWRMLAMANYAVSPGLLTSHLPDRTELDLWQGRCYVSLVGFLFARTTLKGVPIPFHRNFEEVNLRFYVRRRMEDGSWRRGVVFVGEIVPRPALVWVANTVYKERYRSLPMRHSWTTAADSRHTAYEWKLGRWNHFSIDSGATAVPFGPGSEEAFITEHYWGYNRLGPGKTMEYGVEHPSWKVFPVRDARIDVDFGAVYGPAFGFLKGRTPESLLLAEGSPIVVRSGRLL